MLFLPLLDFFPPSFLGRYSLSTCASGCDLLCLFYSLLVFVSIFFSSEIFQSIIQKLYCTTGSARLFIAFILFLPFSSVRRINLTLLLYSFLILSFIVLYWMLNFCMAVSSLFQYFPLTPIYFS